MSKPWHKEALALVESGISTKKAAALLGKSEHAVRFALDIGGCREKTKARVRKLRARQRVNGYSEKRELARQEPVVLDDQVLRTYGGSTLNPRQTVITLPKVSIPDLCECRPQLRIAPRTRWSAKPGVDRIRAIHLKMIREGRIQSRDLVSEWRQ